jgi:hypothetical protein
VLLLFLANFGHVEKGMLNGRKDFEPQDVKKSSLHFLACNLSYGAFTLDVKSMLNENLGGILGDT